jgi:mono/diheme cytochrome c family protein
MIPPRSSLTSQTGAQVDMLANVELTSQLYGEFKAVCGGCHVESNNGNFLVTESTFPMLVNNSNPLNIYGIITSDTPGVFMPPDTGGGIPFSQRQPSDPVVQLAANLKIWMDQGSPPGSFTLPTPTGGTSAGYAIGATLGAQLTNIGSCIPNQAMIGTNSSAMDQLDAQFAQATSLPPTLDLTDLTTLDSGALAQSGVISYAPTYPLWSDDAEKMRYIRVPHGQSVGFDKASQTFQIPPNTRFYKTFLKAVTDINGNPTFRKIETRLIVSRPDTTMADGTAQQNALFGTYVWNEDETQASLLTDPLRDGKPFADRIFPYVTDEKAAQPIIDSNPSNLQAALQSAGVTRHYALPGSERCTQCHMGSPSASFVLGFTPLQVARRPDGTGGVYEPAMGDELTQLQRLIDYGVITGMTSPADVLPLERSEGARTPRNAYELKAQAYMVGNCAHCHNPRGFPSTKQPALKDVLVFLPGTGPNDGVFQFPLTTMSPVRSRGALQNIPIPYITPSLYDILDEGSISKYFCPDQQGGSCPQDLTGAQWILAPWRSLIYRNTDTPYDYFDDFVPFPHMPFNTSGYDCRVAQIMGDWMVSIPARIKDPTKSQSAFPAGDVVPAYANVDPQPYEEALPGDSDYAAAIAGAATRLSQYHNIGFRYTFCPSTYTADIVDPVVAAQVNANLPVTSDTGEGGFPSPTDPNLLIMPSGLTPIRPNYISFDDTDVPGPWFPRRPDWETALKDPDVPTFIQNATATDGLNPGQVEDLTNVVTALESVKLSDVKSALLQPYPMGLWDTTVPGCDFSSVPTADSYTGANRPQWMTIAPPMPANAPVYVASPGAAVFTTICFNCHGIQADSKGLLADAISNLTGGDARVADLRDGLLGPTTAPGMNREAVFGPDAAIMGLATDDLASRYVAWMTLGGTEKHLPQDVLTEVSQSRVLGQVRTHIDQQGTPDMLKLGLSLCEQIADSDPSSGTSGTQFSLANLQSTGQIGWSQFTGLIDGNGDADMWLRLCNLGNRQFVRVAIPFGGWTANTTFDNLIVGAYGLYWAAGPNGEDWYGANPVMDPQGNVSTGVSASNLFPICVQKPTDPTQLQYATTLLQANKIKTTNSVVPFCPGASQTNYGDFLQESHKLYVDQTNVNGDDYVDGRKWAARGAINAALAVFAYLDEIERNPTQRQPLYTQCNLINSSTGQ